MTHRAAGSHRCIGRPGAMSARWVEAGRGVKAEGRSTACGGAARPGSSRGAMLASVPVPLIGRDADLRTLDDLVGSSRVVTVVGPGGVGKTRLVTEWVRRHGDRFDGGARVVSLA